MFLIFSVSFVFIIIPSSRKLACNTLLSHLKADLFEIHVKEIKDRALFVKGICSLICAIKGAQHSLITY